jgi:voltage-gated potassium channel
MIAKLERFCRRLVDNSFFELLVVLLILLSVVLLTEEIVLPESHPHQVYLYEAQNWITGFFLFELSARYVASRRRHRFLREYWLDILAILPFFRVFRFARFLRLLRLLRLVRLASMLTSNSRLFQFLLRRRAAEYLLCALLVCFCLVSGTLSYSHFEQSNQGLNGLSESIWRVTLMLVAGELPNEPTTWGGRLVILSVAVAGLGIVAFLIGTISAVMIEKLREGALLNRMLLEELEDHLLICGWNSGVETVLQELQRHPDFAQREIVVIAEREDLNLHDLPDPRKIRLLREDFTRVEVLQKANVMKAGVAIIVSDVGHNRTRQDADARTVLAALTIEKLNPDVYTCAELSNSMNEPHLRMGKVNEVIITQELAGRLLAQAALHSAHVKVFQELLQFGSGARLAAHPVPSDLIGRAFPTILTEYRLRTGSLPIALCDASEGVDINPESRVLQAGDQLLCLDNP